MSGLNVPTWDPLLTDYSRQAQGYDSTRSASPSVLRPLRAALDGAPGVELADIGGGTGNYATAFRREGWEPLVIDRSSEMLARAQAKGLRVLEADAEELPLPDCSFDAAMLVSMLHHVRRPEMALSEARRILRPGGRLALMLYTREDTAGLWWFDYFPSAWGWVETNHPPLAEIQQLLPGARVMPVLYEDLEDATLAALTSHPELVLQQSWRTQISFFERMERDHAEELERGLERLAADVDTGRVPQQHGPATVLAWEKGGPS